MLKISDISNLVDKEEEKEFEEAFQRSRKLRNYYNKQLSNGWCEEASLLNTYDEWFYHKELYR